MRYRFSRVSLLLLLAVGFVAQLLAQDLPDSATSQLKQSVAHADRATSDPDKHLALARLGGALMSDGVRLGIQEASLGPRAEERRRAVAKALEVWKTRLEGDMPVNLVSPSEAPQVVVEFVPAIPDQGANALGLIRLERQYQWSARRHTAQCHGTISIAVAYRGRSLSEEELTQVVMHELGHLIGLDDAPSGDLLMAPMRMGITLGEPTNGEVADVRQLRAALRARIGRLEQAFAPRVVRRN